jgi:tetratricopeptide (TPR) repeat protein
MGPRRARGGSRGRPSRQEAVEIAEALDHPFSLGMAYHESGRLALFTGDLKAAVPPLERSLRVTGAANVANWRPWVLATLGHAHVLAGRSADALPILEEALQCAAATGFMFGQGMRTAWLAEAHLSAGRWTEAHALAERALALSREHRERGYEAWCLRLLGKISGHCDPPEDKTAEVHYCQALALAEELGMRPLVAHCHLGLGKLYHRASGSPKAAEHFTTAATMYREMDMGFYLAQAEAALKEGG